MRGTLLCILGLFLTVPALAAPGSITVVNGTDAPLRQLEIRAVGKGWAPLATGLSPGARATVSLDGDDCAYDVRGSVAGGGSVAWNRLNLCEVNSVTLNRRADGASWADYD